jgi:hypothetical protein
MPGNAVAVHAATNWNLIDGGMTAPPPVLSPNSTVPPPSLHLSVLSFLQRKILRAFRKCYFSFSLFPILLIHGLSVFPLLVLNVFNDALNTSYYKTLNDCAGMSLSVCWLGYGLDNGLIF